MLDRHAAERPERVLQANGQRGETLAAEHRLGMLPGRIGQHEVIQPMVQRLAGDADAGIGHVGEVRQRLLSGHMVLTEDHLPIGAVLGAPGADPALQATTQPIPVMIGMTQLHLLEQGNRSQAGMASSIGRISRSHNPVKRIGRRGDRGYRKAGAAKWPWSRCGGRFAR